ncbi:Fe-S cluster assembly protein SufD [Candidatus Endowatersipora endosymbiont of Watersipora subatra]|uniref:Fe-S cluster assembly protein SufD n=1 Tax=Candidatus Endowatersipora endosymbiont of Watersipora subatra TaxID=3077946 RepID=UPI00312CA4CA
MNSHINHQKILTKTEESLIEIAAALPQSEARASAMLAFQKNGFPTRRVEAFHYTDLRSLLKDRFSAAKYLEEDPRDLVHEFLNRKLINDSTLLTFYDAHYFDRDQVFPKGVAVIPMIPILKQVENKDDTLAIINTMLADDGLLIRISDCISIDNPIDLSYIHSGQKNTLSANRVSINVGAQASCHFLERSFGYDDISYFSSHVTDLTIGDNAIVNYTILNEDGDHARRLAQLNVTLGKNTTLNLFILNVSSAMSRQELNLDLRQEGAALKIRGVNLVGGNSHCDVTSRINHHVPCTRASEIFHNIVTDQGEGVFQGQINVEKIAQMTDARMKCNTLLLSNNCDFSAKPELKIFADNVQCSHGATVTDIENSHIFYLMARGIPETISRCMLIRAFVDRIIDEIESECLREGLRYRIDDWIERYV